MITGPETANIREQVARWLDPDVLITEFETHDPLNVEGTACSNNSCPLRNLLYTKLRDGNSQVVDVDVDTTCVQVFVKYGSVVQIAMSDHLKSFVYYIDHDIAQDKTIDITAGEVVTALRATKAGPVYDANLNGGIST